MRFQTRPCRRPEGAGGSAPDPARRAGTRASSTGGRVASLLTTAQDGQTPSGGQSQALRCCRTVPGWRAQRGLLRTLPLLSLFPRCQTQAWACIGYAASAEEGASSERAQCSAKTPRRSLCARCVAKVRGACWRRGWQRWRSKFEAWRGGAKLPDGPGPFCRHTALSGARSGISAAWQRASAPLSHPGREQHQAPGGAWRLAAVIVRSRSSWVRMCRQTRGPPQLLSPPHHQTLLPLPAGRGRRVLTCCEAARACSLKVSAAC